MKRATEPLTDLAIQAMKPGETLRDGADGLDGFEVRCRASGRRFFSFRGGVPRRRVTCEKPYPLLTLKEARAWARALREAADKGEDPAAERDRVRAEQRSRAERELAAKEGRPTPGTFAAIAAAYLTQAKRRMRPRTYTEEARKLRVEILPAIGGRQAAEIRRGELVALLEAIQVERGGVCSNRSRSILSRVFNYAAERELVPGNPTPRKPLHREQPRQRVLTSAELRALWQATEALGVLTRGAWRLVLLTAQRPGEVMAMKWADLVIEGGATWWRLAAEKTKTGRAHRVFVSRQALAEVEALRPITGATPFVFASLNDPGKLREKRGTRAAGVQPLAWLSQSSPRLRRRVAAELVRQAADAGTPAPEVERFTPHDCRRTAATMMGAAGVRPDVVDRVLNHAPGKITRTYNTASYEAEVRQALTVLGEAVARAVAGEQGGGQVLAFPGSSAAS